MGDFGLANLMRRPWFELEQLFTFRHLDWAYFRRSPRGWVSAFRSILVAL
jgi:hypothetical protein